MFEIKTILVSVCLILLATASFCMYWACLEKKMGHHCKIGYQSPCKNENKKYCLNGGKCCYLIDEDIKGCNCTWL